ncbi:MAG: DEAD/DEAH box helicase, partial [bacterium]
MEGILAALRAAPEYNQIRQAVTGQGAPPSVRGPGGPAAACLIAAIATDAALSLRPILVVTPTQDAAERLADDLKALLAGERPHRAILVHPEVQIDPPANGAAGATAIANADVDAGATNATRTAERLAVLDALAADAGVIVVASASVAADPLLSPDAVRAATRIIRPGEVFKRDQFVADLTAAGYERVPLVVSPGEFAVRGGIVDVFPASAERPVRLELWGDVLDSLREFDPTSQRSHDALHEATIRPVQLRVADGDGVALPAHLRAGGLLVLYEPEEAAVTTRGLAERAQRTDAPAPVPWSATSAAPPGARRLSIAAARPPEGDWKEVHLPSIGLDAFGGQTHLLAQMLEGLATEGLRVVIASAQASRVVSILNEAGVNAMLIDRLDEPPAPGRIVVTQTALSRGFRLDAAGLAVVTDAEIVGWRRRRPRMRFLREGERLTSWADLTPGDLVVHLHHGIGRYRGLTRLRMDGAEREYLLLEYAQEDRLYVPTDQIGLVQRYIGAEGEAPRIHRLGGAEWDREKRRVKEAAREMAASLLTLYAARATTPGHAFGADTPWQREMEAAFPHQETPHQRTAIEEVKRDMELPRPMDRLVAGDVGYGKTEVALRAAFKAVMDGKQVAMIVPTTILAQQHFSVFSERFAAFPITVELLSRFRSPAEQKDVLAKTAAGGVDVLIGTHRLLGKDVRFRDLGLVIVDEEQRFGVAHKEHLKALRKSVDVLTLTATPIPRTLHMSLAGLRDLSVMDTPPEARLPIHTEIRPEDDDLIQSVILRERARGGQVYV